MASSRDLAARVMAMYLTRSLMESLATWIAAGDPGIPVPVASANS